MKFQSSGFSVSSRGVCLGDVGGRRGKHLVSVGVVVGRWVDGFAAPILVPGVREGVRRRF